VPAGVRLQGSPGWWCPACQLRQEGGDTADDAVEVGEGAFEAPTRGFGQARVILSQRQRFGQQAQIFAVARIEALPKPPLATAVVAEPGFAATGGLAVLGLGGAIGVLGLADHFSVFSTQDQ